MAIQGRSLYIQSNVVRNVPSLPIAMYDGSLSVQLSFQDHPSATLEYRDIPIEDIAPFQSVYNPRTNYNKIIRIYGIPFHIVSFAYTRKPHSYKEDIFDTYQVSVSLEGAWRRGYERKVKVRPLIRDGKITGDAIARASRCNYVGPNFSIEREGEIDSEETISLSDVLPAQALIRGCILSFHEPNGIKMQDFDRGRTWSFQTEAIFTDGDNSISLPVFYNGSELTGKFSDFPETDPPGATSPQPDFQQREPVIEVTIEDEDDAETIPADTKILRGLDSNFDMSGPRKTRKTTTTIDGKPWKEYLEVFAFAYLAKDIIQPDGSLFSAEPQKYWRLIEDQNTQHIHSPLQMPPVYVKAFDPSDAAFEGALRLVIHPDYRSVVGLGGGVNPPYILKRSNVEYLTEIVTTGFKLNRHIKETEDLSVSTLDPEDPRYPLMKFEAIPKEERSAFYLKSARGLPGYDETSLPFNIEWVNWSDLSPEMQQRINSEAQMGETGNRALGYKVGIITPDLNYVEPLLALTESRQASSFSIVANPENEPGAIAAPAWYITGEESYYKSAFHTESQANRQVGGMVKVNQGYRNKIAEFSAQDPGFKASSERISTVTGPGVKPPQADYRNRAWEQKETSDRVRKLILSQTATRKRYFLYSDDIPPQAEITDSKSYPEAETLAQAKKAAELELDIETLQSSIQGSKTVTWFYPQIRPADRATFGRDRFSKYGKWFVLGCSWSLEFNGNNNIYGLNPFVTCEGTQLDLGMEENRSVRVVTREESVPFPDGNEGDADAKVVLGNSLAIEMGKVLPNAPGRRK